MTSNFFEPVFQKHFILFSENVFRSIFQITNRKTISKNNSKKVFDSIVSKTFRSILAFSFRLLCVCFQTNSSLFFEETLQKKRKHDSIIFDYYFSRNDLFDLFSKLFSFFCLAKKTTEQKSKYKRSCLSIFKFLGPMMT